MLIDFRANRIVLIASLALATLLITLFVAQGAPLPQLFVLVIFFGLFIAFNLRRMALKTIRQWEYRLMVQHHAAFYQEAYQNLLRKGFKYNPRWQVTKYQRAILGSVLNGDFEQTTALRKEQNTGYQTLIDADPYFNYLNKVTLGIEALLVQSKTDIIEAMHQEQEALKRLDPKYQDQIKQNPHSFSNLFQTLKSWQTQSPPEPETLASQSTLMLTLMLAYRLRLSPDSKGAEAYQKHKLSLLNHYDVEFYTINNL